MPGLLDLQPNSTGSAGVTPADRGWAVAGKAKPGPLRFGEALGHRLRLEQMLGHLAAFGNPHGPLAVNTFDPKRDAPGLPLGAGLVGAFPLGASVAGVNHLASYRPLGGRSSAPSSDNPWASPILRDRHPADAVAGARWRLRDLNFLPSSRQTMKSGVIDRFGLTAGSGAD